MKWLATKRIAIKSIVLPGNFAATKAAARIADLATSIRETDGPIQPPVVEAKTMRLIAGHDRIAALMMLREKHVEVRTWQGTEQELRIVQLDENLRRRHDDRNALISERARVEAGVIVENTSAEGGTAVPPMQSVKSEARKRVAKVAGVTPAAVRKAEQRAAAKVEEASAAPVAEGDAVDVGAALAAPLPDGFNAFGLEVRPEHRERIVELAQALTAWEQSTRRVLTELARLEKVANPPLLSRQQAESIRDKAHALGHVIREAMPTSLCFYCKNDDRSAVDCAACGATGLAGRHAGDNVPPELKTTGANARIAVDGRFILASEPVHLPTGAARARTSPAANVATKPKAVNQGKSRIRVVAVDETGAETEVPLPQGDDEELAF